MPTQQPKVWFITGAGKGLGRAIAEAALAHGDFVAATTRNAAGLAYTTAYPKQALALQLDVSCTDEAVFTAAIQQTIAAFGRIDVLVNNAGFGSITNFGETSEETIRRTFETNLFGLMRVTRAVLPIMRTQHSGHIFNIASAAGYGAGPVCYHTSKFAVTGFSVTLANCIRRRRPQASTARRSSQAGQPAAGSNKHGKSALALASRRRRRSYTGRLLSKSAGRYRPLAGKNLPDQLLDSEFIQEPVLSYLRYPNVPISFSEGVEFLCQKKLRSLPKK